MPDIAQSLLNIHLFDELARRKNSINSLHPLVKLIVTGAFLVFVVSFGKHDVTRLLPFAVYPVFILSLADIPLKPLFSKMLVAVPFIFGIGIFNLIFDTDIIMYIYKVPITSGGAAFIALFVKCVLTVLAALLLIATTGMDNIIRSFRILHIPKIFVIQIMLMYRYISVLLEEASRIWNAYRMRAPGQKGIKFSLWGPLAGQMLIRTYERAQRVYQAMLLRGFNGEYTGNAIKKAGVLDCLYCAAWILFFAIARYYDIPSAIGKLVTQPFDLF